MGGDRRLLCVWFIRGRGCGLPFRCTHSLCGCGITGAHQFPQARQISRLAQNRLGVLDEGGRAGVFGHAVGVRLEQPFEFLHQLGVLRGEVVLLSEVGAQIVKL